MNWKRGFIVGLLSGVIFETLFLYGQELFRLPPLVATIGLAIGGWFFKKSYENYVSETNALRLAESTLAINLVKNQHNRDFFNEWRKALREDRLYTVVFRQYVLLKDFDAITDNKLWNTFLKLNLSFEGFNLDLKNLYESYQNGSSKMLFESQVDAWHTLNQNVLNQTEDFERNFEMAEEDSVAATAKIRCYFSIMKITVFRLIKLLGLRVYPFAKQSSIEEEIAKIKKKLQEDRVNSSESDPNSH